jgi:TonB-dependent receptor
MSKYFYSLCAVVLLCGVLGLNPVAAQEKNGSISGHATDANHDALVGARVELLPNGRSVVTDSEGAFTISDLPPGAYTLIVSYVGFTPFSASVTVTSGSTVKTDATLKIEAQNEQLIVRGEREHGEVEALNREETADNIVQVLPAEVITSLPNTNIADAVGRLPSVSLERDEGEGKYVQIRGTEPRLSNVTFDGIHLPSPESVRQVKLDAVPSALVDSVEINKTLSPSQEGDAIGGSVNLVSKRAGEQPYLDFSGMGGYTPVGLGGALTSVGATYGRRVGTKKRLGLLIGGSYDFNQRGTDDIEPSQGSNQVFAAGPSTAQTGTFNGPNGMDVREYTFYRHRYGFVGSVDYKLGENSALYLRGLFSQFKDNGEDWIYTPSVGTFTSATTTANDGAMDYSHVIRRPAQRIFSFVAGANHSLGKTLVAYEVALGQGRSTGGFYSANVSGPSNVQFNVITSNPFLPKFNQVAGDNIFDPANYTLGGPHFHFFRAVSMSTDNHIFERDLTGSISVARQYTVGSHFSTFEVGFKVRDTHKSSHFFEPTFDTFPSFTPLAPLTSFVGGTANPNPKYYLGGNYKLLPLSNFDNILSYFKTNYDGTACPAKPGDPTPKGSFCEDKSFEHLISDSNDYHTLERVTAGYVQNTITLGRFRVLGGLRIEGTQGSFVGTFAKFDSNGTFQTDLPLPGEQRYVDFLPSVQVQYSINSSTSIRAAYGRGIARPNFSDLPPYFLVDSSRNPTRVSVGNSDLKTTHANDYDLLFEHYFKTVGVIEAGWFYKDLTDPIVVAQTTLPIGTPLPDGTKLTSPAQEKQSINLAKGHLQGVEFAWQQHLTFLPGLMNGMGVSANYSYTTSRTAFPAGFDPTTSTGPTDPGQPNRTDNPALARQAPNNWNFDATYDKGPISARLALSHNDRSIFAYNFQSEPTPVQGGIRGPLGDVYYYPHTQVDAQFSYRLPHAHGLHLVGSFLNLTNEVFGFYQGSEIYPIQREYYSRTMSGGIRWTSTGETSSGGALN